jgi:hypothetical protein
MNVFIYWNLHKNCWSIKNLKTGRVMAHADQVSVKNVVFKVSEAGRQRVINEKRKNVHAGVKGQLVDYTPRGGQKATKMPNLKAVSYNPYRGPTFFYKADDSPAIRASGAFLDSKMVWV